MRWLIMIAIADLWVGLTNRNSTFYKTLFNMIAFIATFITNLFVQSPFNNEKFIDVLRLEVLEQKVIAVVSFPKKTGMQPYNADILAKISVKEGKRES